MIRFSSLGDIVLSSFLIRRLRGSFSNSTIDMISGEQYLHLLKRMSYLDSTLIYPLNDRMRRTFRREIVSHSYDTVIDLQNNLSSRELISLINPARVYRFHRSRFNRWLRINFPSLRKKIGTPPHVALGYLSSVRALNVTDDKLGLELSTDSNASKEVRLILHKYHQEVGLPLGTRPLILSPSARHKTKIWLVEHWLTLMNSAKENGFISQVVVGSAQERDFLDDLISQLNFPVLNTAGEVDLNGLTAFISLGQALISSHSGPMHIASAVNTPVVAIFGSTVPEFGFAPFRCKSEIIQIEEELDCRPCHPHGKERCPRKHFRCMADISPMKVLEALKRVTSTPLNFKLAGNPE